MEMTTLGALLDVGQTRLLVIRDGWSGMSEHSPVAAVYELRRGVGGGFAGEGHFSTRHVPVRELPVTLSPADAAHFLDAVSRASAVARAYKPLFTHTDDFPRIEIAFHIDNERGNGAIALLFTTSQGEFHAPWGACIDGELFTLPDDAVGRALRAQAVPLRREVLDAMTRSDIWTDSSPSPLPDPRRTVDRLSPQELHDEVFVALWMRGALTKEAAIRCCAEHFRSTGRVDYQRLRADGELHARMLAAIDGAASAGKLDRPSRGYVRAGKPEAIAYSVEDWRGVLLASLGDEAQDRDTAIRVAADWAKEHLGLAFSRMRMDGHIAQGLRSAINSAVRRGDVVRHGSRAIRRPDVEAPQREGGERPPELDAVTVEADTPVAPAIEVETEPRHFDGSESVLVLQMPESASGYEALSLVSAAISTLLIGERPRGAAVWRFFLGLGTCPRGRPANVARDQPKRPARGR